MIYTTMFNETKDVGIASVAVKNATKGWTKSGLFLSALYPGYQQSWLQEN